MSDEYSPAPAQRQAYAKGYGNATQGQLMRRTATPAQSKLFSILIEQGYKAHDEHPIPTDIFDEEFQCFKVFHADCFIEPNLDVEYDGGVHKSARRRAKDAKRDTWLTSHGWTVLRFENREALAHPERVLAAIDENGGLKWG